MKLSILSAVPAALFLAACGGSDPAGFGSNPTTDDAGNPIVDGAAADDGGTVGPDGSTARDSSTPPVVTSTPLVSGLAISEVAIFQTVKIGLMKGGSAVTPKPPVVADRAGLVRVYLAPQSGWSPHVIQAQLLLDSGGVVTPYPVDATPSGASTEASLASTINFEIPANVFKTDTKFSVALHEKTGPKTSVTTSPAQWPNDGSEASLGVVSTGAQIHIVIVPIAYGADGSGRLPDTSPAQVQKYKDLMMALYPTPNVDVTVRATPLPINFTVSANGTGWNTILSSLLQARASDKPASDVYYYGAFSPASSMNAFCGGGCVSGLSPLVTNPNDSASRGSVGLGFSGDGSAGTMAHEVGHAHGRSHAPCGGASGADPAYPYAGGGIGTWGYSTATKKLMDPAQYKDIMGYCSPTWFSDYTYGGILTRVKAVNGANVISMAPMPFRFATVDADGAIAWVGGEATLDVTPGGEPRDVEYLDASGTVVATKTGYFYELDHLPGGQLIAPPMPSGAVRTRLVGVAKTGVLAVHTH